ncbi:hypothetical protein AUK04_00350 [Candidatus Roizmanbacteria bacterium CG2_30_33_16]|uniref:Uncharacterized protein n=4 Tax=Candidatus Roizmaniibacteriota TaxID=1752723 RepID=A0A2H0C3F8_9BACT|nr:hypothetical protein [Candidatus Roizmanbacteria bacterium]OIP86645.1 MAG: hypothetical protein AUK04_00350 [Candidatus Roizmanbacteria bacterium CG2_30_33_16]PIP64447.1 MAG: hypothetical protein COW96_02395 [Candidatus Roizmanbacteria bacterium CG22_combo_CG10-13_8_21_14_all_33_16]PIX73799.1 MAG: hypothetical protein COZ39_01785 [Candidatus Roizmanbacteria bacterium CG_4_10_14_3_um_filter_33_21]PJB87903.1 MAG: hypothetical protein CO083_04490 [Candidatus Roizmanbacteria bacterium CG_4_9_14_
MKKFFKQYQKEVAELVKKFNFNWSVYVQYIHLVEEVGELGETLTVLCKAIDKLEAVKKL